MAVETDDPHAPRHTRGLLHRLSVMAAGLLTLSGCRPPTHVAAPAVIITQLPVSSMGGPDRTVLIAGQVQGARPNQQVVLYTRSGVWWVQPFANQPFTRIRADSSWQASIHLGTEYAALLVDAGYSPASKLTALPPAGSGVAALTMIAGRPDLPKSAQTLHFSGYDWLVRSGESDHGGDPNTYDNANAWVDGKGYLHLRMQERRERWTCAEVSLKQSLGYGTYQFTVEDTASLVPTAVLGIFTWDDTHSENLHSEMDIELSRWGEPAAENAQYVKQPFFEPENMVRFSVPSGVLMHQFDWQPGHAGFSSFAEYQGSRASQPFFQHSFSGHVPVPKNETVHIDLFDYHHDEHSSTQPTEVVIRSFRQLL